MDIRDSHQPDSASKYLEPMEKYKEAVLRLFPQLPRPIMNNCSMFLNNCSMFPVDAVILGYFLEHYPRRVMALEIGAFVGISAFCLASHPKVSKVVSVDPNPVISDELTANSDKWIGREKLESLKNFKVLEVALTVLAEFEEEREKIEFHEGVVGSTEVGAKGGTIAGLRKVEVPVVDPSEGEGLVALVDGLHTKEGVREDLVAVFEKNPHAVALMDDCRYGWGHLVQAGVVDFMEQAEEVYHFRLFGDLGPGLAGSSFGIVYPESAATEMNEVLDKIRKVSRRQLNPVRLLKQKEELSATASRVNRELQQARENEARLESRVSQVEERSSDLQEQVSRLKEHNARLLDHYSSRRYKLADAIVGGALRIPGLKSLLRDTKQSGGRG